MSSQDLLWHAKQDVTLWQRLGVKGINNCGARKLQLCEEEAAADPKTGGGFQTGR